MKRNIETRSALAEILEIPDLYYKQIFYLGGRGLPFCLPMWSGIKVGNEPGFSNM